jgi:hypothetical protein
VLQLRADPWTPDHGMGFEARLDETSATADPDVETTDWSRPFSPGEHPETPLWFVDGVRRIELRVLADDDAGRRGPGLFGSWAVGSVRCDGRAVFGEHDVGRAVVLGGGLRPDHVRIRVGGVELVYEPHSESGSDPDAPLLGLQSGMRESEATLATRLAGTTERLILVDGPLHRRSLEVETTSPVVGVVKRFVRAYLDAGHDALLSRLRPGERTPLFGLASKDHPIDRFAWYTRLVDSPRTWHDHAGLVRCEVRAGVGLDRARELADRVSGLLPRYAGRATDPRYPQNLAPVGGLEGWLQHRMGHRALIRRALQEWLSGEVAA